MASAGPRAARSFLSSFEVSRTEAATKLRIASGLVLMVFLTSHLVNHALGIISLQAMETGREAFRAVWSSPPGQVFLYGALLIHVALVIHKLYRRRSLKMPVWEMVQVGLGVLIPSWLVVHIIGTRGLSSQFGVHDSYPFVLNTLWPEGAMQQTILVIVSWLHGCIGVHFWLRHRPWYQRVTLPLFTAALLLPTLSLFGFVSGGREVRALAEQNPALLETLAEHENWPDQSAFAWVYTIEGYVLSGLMMVLAAVLVGRVVRSVMMRRSGRVRVHYPDGAMVSVNPGTSVLEASRVAGIPHASVCGGRGRCSTCRVRIEQGAETLAPPAKDEAKVLARIGATPSVRLACQVRPVRDLSVVPLLASSVGPGDAKQPVNPGQGIEREIAVLFADLRAFTRMAEGRLPYDVVFVLNQYFKSMGEAIEGQGGRIDKFIGDGIMALFGLDHGRDEACRQALAGARAMSSTLVQLNQRLGADLREPLRIGIGLHVGPVILGQMGYGRATSLTAIGDTVNVASRLEALTKEFGVELVVSSRLAETADVDLQAFEERQIDIRGRRRPLRVRLVTEASELSVPGAGDVAAGSIRNWLRAGGRKLGLRAT
ncbi:MAG: adenylate/guanylate cyclase domain-containing protein [Pseudomonadota bacterium]